MNLAIPPGLRRSVAVLALTGCATPPAVWVPPEAFAVTATSLLPAPEAASRPGTTREMRLRVFALPSVPADEGVPLAAAVSSFRRPADAVPLRAVGRGTLTGRAAHGALGTRFVAGLADGALAPRALLAEANAAAPKGTKVIFEPREEAEPQGALAPPSWRLEAVPEGEAYRAEVTLVRYVPDLGSDELEAAPRGTARKLRNEDRLLLAGTTGPGSGPLVLAVPWTDRHGAAFALVLALDLSEAAPTPASQPARTLVDPATAAAARAAASRPASRAELESEVVATLWKRLAERPHQRAALARAAEYGAAALSADVVLIADAALVARICERAAELARSEGSPPTDRVRLGWLLERACIVRLAEEVQRGTISPALEGQMWIHLGEAARGLDSLLRSLDRIGTCAAFRAWLAEEQESALSDRIPSVRLRAHAWLQRAGRPVPGFDPLGPLAARRAALRAHEDAAATRPSPRTER